MDGKRAEGDWLANWPQVDADDWCGEYRSTNVHAPDCAIALNGRHACSCKANADGLAVADNTVRRDVGTLDHNGKEGEDVSVKATWSASLDCECPNCKRGVDLMELPTFWESHVGIEIAEHDTPNTTDMEAECPKCGHEFTVTCEW